LYSIWTGLLALDGLAIGEFLAAIGNRRFKRRRAD
jgi:hypothetical protein